MVGTIPPSGIHRITEDSEWADGELRAELLGTNAVEYVNELEKNLRQDTSTDDILKATIEEIELDLARMLETRGEVYAIFGSGMWRPLPRHLIFQDERPRCIDDTKAGQQNWCSAVSEAIVCASAEWPAVTVRALLQYIQRMRGA